MAPPRVHNPDKVKAGWSMMMKVGWWRSVYRIMWRSAARDRTSNHRRVFCAVCTGNVARSQGRIGSTTTFPPSPLLWQTIQFGQHVARSWIARPAQCPRTDAGDCTNGPPRALTPLPPHHATSVHQTTMFAAPFLVARIRAYQLARSPPPPSKRGWMGRTGKVEPFRVWHQ